MIFLGALLQVAWVFGFAVLFAVTVNMVADRLR
jgi:hypothetical protein